MAKNTHAVTKMKYCLKKKNLERQFNIGLSYTLETIKTNLL